MTQKPPQILRNRNRKERDRRFSVSSEAVVSPLECNKDSLSALIEVQADEKMIFPMLRQCFLFEDLSTFQLQLVHQKLVIKEYVPGEMIVNKNISNDHFFLIKAGGVAETLSDKTGQECVLRVLSEGDFFGEKALMYSSLPTLNYVASTVTTLVTLSRKDFRLVLAATENEKRREYEKFLRKSTLGKLLNNNDEVRVADVLDEVAFEEGDVIIHHGENYHAGMKFYILMTGEVEAIIQTKNLDGWIRYGTLKEGDVFGERSLLLHEPRSITIRCKTKVTCAFMAAAAFIRLLGHREFDLRKYDKINLAATQKPKLEKVKARLYDKSFQTKPKTSQAQSQTEAVKAKVVAKYDKKGIFLGTSFFAALTLIIILKEKNGTGSNSYLNIQRYSSTR